MYVKALANCKMLFKWKDYLFTVLRREERLEGKGWTDGGGKARKRMHHQPHKKQ